MTKRYDIKKIRAAARNSFSRLRTTKLLVLLAEARLTEAETQYETNLKAYKQLSATLKSFPTANPIALVQEFNRGRQETLSRLAYAVRRRREGQHLTGTIKNQTAFELGLISGANLYHRQVNGNKNFTVVRKHRQQIADSISAEFLISDADAQEKTAGVGIRGVQGAAAPTTTFDKLQLNV